MKRRLLCSFFHVSWLIEFQTRVLHRFQQKGLSDSIISTHVLAYRGKPFANRGFHAVTWINYRCRLRLKSARRWVSADWANRNRMDWTLIEADDVIDFWGLRFQERGIFGDCLSLFDYLLRGYSVDCGLVLVWIVKCSRDSSGNLFYWNLNGIKDFKFI